MVDSKGAANGLPLIKINLKNTNLLMNKFYSLGKNHKISKMSKMQTIEDL